MARAISKDGRSIVTPFPARSGFNSYVTGQGDDVVTPSRADGQRVKLSWTAGEAGAAGTDKTKELELQFIEPVDFHDGQATWGPTTSVWNSGDDWFVIKVRIPACPSTDRSGTMDGNALKVATGLGYNIFVPANGDGDAELDLGDGTPADLGTVVPVVDEDKTTGYWHTDLFTGVVSPAIDGNGNTDLLDVAPPEPRFVNKAPIAHVGTGVWDVDPAKSEWIHPKWKVVIQAHKETEGAGWFGGWFFIYREKTWRGYP